MSKQKVKILSWKPVATWNWDVKNEDVCGICHNAFEMAAPGVQCIMKWLAQPQSNNTCPICRQYFEFQTGDH